MARFLKCIDLSNHRVRCVSEKKERKPTNKNREEKKKIRGDAMCAPRLIPQDS